MTYKTKRAIVKTAKAAARAVVGVVSTALKCVGVLLLVLITTGAIFACIFVIYIKTNLVSADLGATLEEYQLNETSIIYYYDGSLDRWVESASIIGEGGYMYWVPYDDIPKDMEHALVSIEDQRFYKHHGVDWLRTGSAFLHMFLGNSTFGGSTITQQLRKNITGDNDGTVRRKLTEIFAALDMEKKYDKWQIIEWYLNVVNFGHGESKGIGDAARYYFDKEVKDLSLAEMCSIIGITNNPSMYNPYLHPEANKKRQETILYKMYEQEYIDRQTYEAAKAEELHFVRGDTGGASDAIYSWFDETVLQDAAEFLAEQRGLTPKAARSLLATGGFKIYSTMDPEIQACVDQIYGSTDYINSLGVTGRNRQGDTITSRQFQSSIVITDPYTGNIVALAGSVGEKKANLLYNMATTSRRPPGSSFKPVAVYAPAMDYGIITPNTRYDDGATELEGKPGWMPNNDDFSTHGIVTIRTAIINSYNRVSAQVLDDLTPEASYHFLTEKLRMNLDEADMDYAPLCLGQLTYGITVREMAQAFGIFPNEGQFIETRTFTEIYDSDWNLIYENRPETEGVISPITAYWMTDMLHDAAVEGTGSRANLGDMPTAGKTGSSDNYQDRWFVGFTPYYVAAVWTGYETPLHISSSGNPACYMWKAVMSEIHKDLPIKQWSEPQNTYQTPVTGVETADYIIRAVTPDEEGVETVIYESRKSAVVGSSATASAPMVDGYVLVSPATITVVVTIEPEDNVAKFIYYPVKPPEPDPPPVEPDPNGGEEPGGTEPDPNGGEEPGGTEPDPNGGEEPGGTEPDPNGGEEPGGTEPDPNGGEEPGGTEPDPNGGGTDPNTPEGGDPGVPPEGGDNGTDTTSPPEGGGDDAGSDTFEEPEE